MKRLLLIAGPVIALMGALGFLMSGGTLVGVLDVLAHDVSEPPPASLSELPGAVASAMAIILGLAVSCVATVQRHGTRVISVIGRLLFVGAGLSLIAATIPIAWAVLQVKAAFRIIATASTAPTPDALQAMIQSTEPKMVIGAIILLVATGLMAAGGLVGFQPQSSTTLGSRTAFRIALAIGSFVVGAMSLVLLTFVLSHGNALQSIVSDFANAPKPAELATHLQVILNGTLLAFGGMATQGVLQILAAINAPSAMSEAVSDD